MSGYVLQTLLSIVLLGLALVRKPDLITKPLDALGNWLKSTGEKYSQVNLGVEWRRVISGLVTLLILTLLSTADVAIVAKTVENIVSDGRSVSTKAIITPGIAGPPTGSGGVALTAN